MATKLKTPVVRETDLKIQGRNIIVELGIVTFHNENIPILRLREKGRRITYEITVAGVYSMAAKKFAENEAKLRAEEKKIRRVAR